MAQHSYIKIAISLILLLQPLDICPMKQETPALSDEILRQYRNLIFIIDHGSEVDIPQKLMLVNFIFALGQKNACIITTAALWDHFLQTTFHATGAGDFNARVFFDPTQWEVFRQCVECDIDPKTPMHQHDCFYIFVPKEYVQRLRGDASKVDLNLLFGIRLGDPVPKPLAANEPLAYVPDLYRTIGSSFVKFLKNFLIFTQTPATDQTPRYNIYITGHGISKYINNELRALIDQAQKSGYWPDDRNIHTAPPLKTLQEKAFYEGRIAGLPIKNYAEMLELFNANDRTNILFVASCQNGGRHLYMPFVFFSSPHHLSYTLIHNALLDATPCHTEIPPFYKDPNSAAYSIASTIHFGAFFDGISDFTSKQPSPSYTRLINHVANFMNDDGSLRERENVPWVKMPGATEWKLISEIDPAVRDVTLKDVVFISTPHVTQPVTLKDDMALIPLPNPQIYPDELKTISFDAITYEGSLTNLFNNILKPINAPLAYIKIPDGTIMRIKNLNFNNDAQEISVLPRGNVTLHNCIIVFDSPKTTSNGAGSPQKEVPVKSDALYFSENNIFYGARSTLNVTHGKRYSMRVTQVFQATPLTYKNAIARALADQNNNLVSILLQQSPEVTTALQTAQQHVARALWTQGASSADTTIAQHLGEFKATMQKVLQEAKGEKITSPQ